jgi:hypothetical protein
MAEEIRLSSSAPDLASAAAAALRSAAAAAAETLSAPKPSLRDLVTAQEGLRAAAVGAGLASPPGVCDVQRDFLRLTAQEEASFFGEGRTRAPHTHNHRQYLNHCRPPTAAPTQPLPSSNRHHISTAPFPEAPPLFPLQPSANPSSTAGRQVAMAGDPFRPYQVPFSHPTHRCLPLLAFHTLTTPLPHGLLRAIPLKPIAPAPPQPTCPL